MDRILAAHSAGQLDFGENRVQEALQKIGSTTETTIRWHLIGHLQSNKVRKAAGAFALIHSVDSPELLDRLEQVASEAGMRQRVLLQVDLAGEATKHGAVPDQVRAMLDRAVRASSVEVAGLMVLPPLIEDAEQVRPYFRQLCELRDRLASEGVPRSMLGELSMGMSHDFEVAVEEGATLVRVGSAIFGARASGGPVAGGTR